MSVKHYSPRKGFKYELIVGVGSTIVILGLFTAILLLISKAENQKLLWVTVSLVAVIVGWVLVSSQTTGFLDTLKTILGQLVLAILSPINWFGR
jgi:uncharacterized membrane protein